MIQIFGGHSLFRLSVFDSIASLLIEEING